VKGGVMLGRLSGVKLNRLFTPPCTNAMIDLWRNLWRDLWRKTIETLVTSLETGQLNNCVNARFLPASGART
jgi:hypothetical protein